MTVVKSQRADNVSYLLFYFWSFWRFGARACTRELVDIVKIENLELSQRGGAYGEI